MKPENSKRFIDDVIERIKSDTAYAACLKRAFNGSVKSGSEMIISNYCNLNNKKDVEALKIAGYFLAKGNAKEDGTETFARLCGKVAYETSSGKDGDSPMKTRFMKILKNIEDGNFESFVKNVKNTVTIIIQQNGTIPNMDRLAKDISWFNDKTRTSWIQEFNARGEK